MSLLPHRHGPRSGQRPLYPHPTLTPPLTPRTRHATHPGPPPSPHPPPKAPHPRHTHPTPRTRIHRTPRQQRTPEAPSRQPPLTPVTTSTKNLARHTPTGTDQRSTHQHDPLRHAHEHTPPEAPSTSSTSPEHPHPMYVHNPRNAHTEHPFRTYNTPSPPGSSTPPKEHTAPSEHHAPTDNKAPSYLTQNTPHPVDTHPKEATTPTSPIPTQVSQAPPCWTPQGQATPGPKPEGLTTTHAQHTTHPRNEDPPPEAEPSRPVAPPPEGRLHETRDPHLQHQEPPASSTATTTGPSTPQAPTINACYYLHLEPLWLPGEGFEHTARSLRPPGVTPVTVTPVTLHTLTYLSAGLSAGMVVDWGRAQS